MDEDKEIVLIENYLSGNMSEEEKRAFEKRISKEPELKKQVGDYTLLFKAIELKGMKDLLQDAKEELDQADDEAILPSKSKKLHFNGNWLLAASFLLLVGLGVGWFLNRPSLNERLYDSYFYKDIGLPTTMGATKNLEFTEAMTQYKLGNYEEAISVWKDLLRNSPQNDTLNYFVGAAHLVKKDINGAKGFLEKVILNDNTAFKKEAKFYLALIAVRQGDLKKAKVYLEQLDSSEASALLKEIQEL